MSATKVPRRRLGGLSNSDKAPQTQHGKTNGGVPAELVTRPDAIAAKPWAQAFVPFLTLTLGASFIFGTWAWRLQVQSLLTLGSSNALSGWRLSAAWLVVSLDFLVGREFALLVSPTKGVKGSVS